MNQIENIKIEKGKTIITMQPDKYNKITNKNDKPTVFLKIEGKRTYIGAYNDKETALKVRMVVLKMLEEGTYEEWKPKFPHGNAKNKEEFWEDLFERYGLVI